MKKQQRVWLFCSFLFHLVNVSSQASPTLIIPKAVVQLSETAASRTQLLDKITCSDADGDGTRAYLQTVRPSHPCGKCFAAWPEGSGYELVYTPSLGRLSYSQASSYVVAVKCTDEQTTADGSVEVRLVTNTAPFFETPSKPHTADTLPSKGKNDPEDVVYNKIVGKDNEGDAVLYSLTTEPATDLFEIGYASGNIHSPKGLPFLCDDAVKFSVSVKDVYHEPVNKVAIDMTVKGNKGKPAITNTETEKLISESAAEGSQVLLLSLKDMNPKGTARYKLRAEPEQGLEYYTLSEQNNNVRIRTRKTLDYENKLLRSVKLFVDVTDGYCQADTYSVTVNIKDENEEPVITPKVVERCVYEGFIRVNPGWKIVDPDEGENIKWTMDHASFHVDQDTGIVFSKGEFDYERDTSKGKPKTLQVKIKDKGNKKATATLLLTIKDKNDNAPVFNSRVYKVSASNCTRVGALLDKLNAKDKDSKSEGNNLLVYNGTGSNIAVLANGKVTLRKQCEVGQRETIQASVTDQGTYPGPLSGVPTTVQFTCNPCPEPPPTNNNNSGGTTVSSANSNDATGDGSASNDADTLTLHLGWGIAAALLGLLLAGVLTYVIWCYCAPLCARWRMRRALRKKLARTKRLQIKPADKRKLKHLQQRKKEPDPPPDTSIPPAPPAPAPDCDPFLFGFWKETYVDRDQRHMPERDVIPATVEEDKVVEEREKEEEGKEKEERTLERQKKEENYRQEMAKYHQEVEAIRNPPPCPPPPPPRKKKFCHIL